MAFWNRKETRATSGLRYPSDWLTDSLTFGRTASAGTRVNVNNALGLSPVWAAVRIISESVGQLPFKVYRDTGDGEKQEAREHRMWRRLHDRPNSQTPAGRFWSTVSVHLLLYGNAYVRKFRDENGLVDELWLLDPSKVTVKWWPLMQEKTFLYEPGNLEEERREYDDSEVLHVFGFSLDGLVGLSVIETCRQSLGTAIARDEFEGEFYANGAVLSQAILLEGRLRSPESVKRLKDSARALFTGSGKRHGIGVFEDGARPVPVGSPLRDLEFVAAQNMTRTDIAVMFNLPPNVLGGSSGDSLTYATVEANQQAKAIDAIAPIAATIQDAVSQDPSILPQNVMSAAFVLEAMMRADAKSRGEFYKALHEVGAITDDEIRKRENMQPLTAQQRAQIAESKTKPIVEAETPVIPALNPVNGQNGTGEPNGP